MRRLARWLVVVLACGACAGGGIEVTTSVVSSEATGEMTVWSPVGDGPWPVVYLLHGLDGDRGDVDVLGAEIARLGHVVLAPSWTLGPDVVRQLECGYRFARSAAADYGGDADGPMTVVGHSAGASFALGGALFVNELAPNEECFVRAPMPALSVAIAPCVFDEDLSAAGNHDVSLVVVSAADDTVCPPLEQAATVTRLESAGYDVRLVTVDGADHWTLAFQKLEQNTIVPDPESDAGRATVHIITEAIEELRR